MKTIIKEELKRKNINNLGISVLKVLGNKVTINYTLKNERSNLIINFAFFKNGIVQSVKSVENAGKILQYENVVRFFASLSPELKREAK